jgi:hypothetical protein
MWLEGFSRRSVSLGIIITESRRQIQADICVRQNQPKRTSQNSSEKYSIFSLISSINHLFNQLTSLFQGQGPAAALAAVKKSLEPHETANAAICPTANTVYYLWNKFLQDEYGGRTNEEIFSLLEKKIPEYASEGIALK